MKENKKEIVKLDEDKNVVIVKEENMVKQIIVFGVGILLGALITSVVFLAVGNRDREREPRFRYNRCPYNSRCLYEDFEDALEGTLEDTSAHLRKYTESIKNN